MKYSIQILTIITTLVIIGCSGPYPPIGMSPEIFRGTPGWKAVKAIMKDDTCSLGKELNANPSLKTLTDPFYGYTILTTAILNNRVKSTEKLLKFGFDPNFIDESLNKERANEVIHALSLYRTSPEILELLLKYGGNPNSCLGFIERNGKMELSQTSAIAWAATKSLDKVKILLKYDADINPTNGCTPVNMCSDTDSEILLYLLEHGADYNEKFEERDFTNDKVNGEIIGYKTIADRMRSMVYPLDSKEYQYKLKVIEFLDRKGIKYHDTEITKNVLEMIKAKYPDTWEEYIKVY